MTERAQTTLGAATGFVRVPKAAELIADRLRRDIVRGALTPGAVLPAEQTLADEFEVSRPTLREALRLLEAESLIALKRGSRGGAVVSRPSVSVAARSMGQYLQMTGTTLEEIHTAREVVEPVCVRLFTERQNSADLADLRSCLEQMESVSEEELTSSRGPAVWAETTGAFQSIFTERCGNRALAVQAAVLRDIIATHRARDVERGVSTNRAWPLFRKNRGSYARLLQLIESGDGLAVENQWRSHLRVVGDAANADGDRGAQVVELFD